MNLADVNSELGGTSCGEISCISSSTPPEPKEHHLHGKRHNAMPIGRQAGSHSKLRPSPAAPAAPPPGRYPPGIVPASKAVSGLMRRVLSEEQEAEVLRRREERLRSRLRKEKNGRERQEQKALHRKESLAWKSEREKPHPDVRQPGPAYYEPARRLLFPGSPPMQPEPEALEGTWRIYAQMGWVTDLDKLQTPDILAAAAPVVPCQGSIRLRRPGIMETEKDAGNGENGTEENLEQAPRQPMLVGSWHLQHPEGHDKDHGIHPFEGQRLTTLAPTDIRIFPSPCLMGSYEKEEEEEEGEIKEEEEGEIREEGKEEEAGFCGWMLPSSWKCAGGGELVFPGQWGTGDGAVDITCAHQLHVGDELRLRRLDSRCAKEMSSLWQAKPEEAIEGLRAIWERPDDVVDREAEPLLVRSGDMRIMVRFKEGPDHGGVTTSGNIYLCRREGPHPPPEVEPGMDASPMDEQRLMGSCHERRKRKVRRKQGQGSIKQENRQLTRLMAAVTELRSVSLQVTGLSVEDPQAHVKHLKEHHARAEKERRLRQEPQRSLGMAQEEEEVTEEESHEAPDEILRHGMKVLKLKLNQQVEENDRLRKKLRKSRQLASKEAEKELVKQAEEKHDRLRGELRRKNARLHQELGQAREESKETEKELKELAQENARLQQELGRAQEASKEAKKELVKQGDDDRLHQQLGRAQEASKETEKELVKQAENARLHQELGRDWEASKEGEKELVKQAEENARLHQQLGRAQEASKENETKLVKQAEENARLQQELGRAQEASKENETKLVKQAEENARLHQELGRAQEASKENETKLVKLEEENARLQQQLRRAQEASKEAETKLLKQAEKKQDRLRGELRRDRELLKEAEKELTKRTQENARLQKENARLKQELKRDREVSKEFEMKLVKQAEEKQDRLRGELRRDRELLKQADEKQAHLREALTRNLEGLKKAEMELSSRREEDDRLRQENLKELAQEMTGRARSLLHQELGRAQEAWKEAEKKLVTQHAQEKERLHQELQGLRSLEAERDITKKAQEELIKSLRWELQRTHETLQETEQELQKQAQKDQLLQQYTRDALEVSRATMHELRERVERIHLLQQQHTRDAFESQETIQQLKGRLKTYKTLCKTLMRQEQKDQSRKVDWQQYMRETFESQATIQSLEEQVHDTDQLRQQLRRESEEELQALMVELKKQVQEKEQLSWQLCEAKGESQAHVKVLNAQVKENDQLCHDLRQCQEECEALGKKLKKQVQEKDQLSLQLREAEKESQEQLRDLKSRVEEKDQLCEHLQADADRQVCQICVEYNVDRVLLCGHTFCQHCISELEQQELKQPQGSIKKMGCPVCRQSLASLMPELDKMLKQTSRKRGRDLVDDEHHNAIISYPLKLFKS